MLAQGEANEKKIDQALAMSETEKRQRMQALRKTIRKYDIKAWADEQRRLFEASKTLNGEPSPSGHVLSAA